MKWVHNPEEGESEGSIWWTTKTVQQWASVLTQTRNGKFFNVSDENLRLFKADVDKMDEAYRLARLKSEAAKNKSKDELNG